MEQSRQAQPYVVVRKCLWILAVQKGDVYRRLITCIISKRKNIGLLTNKGYRQRCLFEEKVNWSQWKNHPTRKICTLGETCVLIGGRAGLCWINTVYALSIKDWQKMENPGCTRTGGKIWAQKGNQVIMERNQGHVKTQANLRNHWHRFCTRKWLRRWRCFKIKYIENGSIKPLKLLYWI